MKKWKILIVDDERDFVTTTAFHLEFKGYEVIKAYSSGEALERVKDKPDIILLDVIMPEVDGYQLCSKLREDPKTRNIPIMMLTCKDDVLDKVEGLKLGADDYIVKTVESEVLYARIEAILRRRAFFAFAEKEKASLIIELRDIINKKTVDTLLQPILSLGDRKIMGYEIFSRGPKGSPLENPSNLFYVAENSDMLLELEIVVRQKALEKLSGKLENVLIFINTPPIIVQSESFNKILDLYKDPERIVLEITERTRIPDFKIFAEQLAVFKKKGFKISLDDIGSGYSNFESILELRPDFAKIDKCLIQEIEISRAKKNLVNMIHSVCKDNSISVVAEGIEREEQLTTLIELGIECGQGYFLGFPKQI